MASEAITRNDLTAILNEVLPPTPSEYRKLLWTNPSPTSSFAAQTVSLDLSDYDEVEIAVRLYSGGSSPVTFARGSVGLLSSALGVRNDSFLTQIRQFTPQTSGVQFYDCKLGSNSSTYNDQMIPLNIYGIKYERVNPPQAEIADVVVEQGTETVNGVVWTYRKWDSGIAECWTKVLHTITSWTAWYSWYYSNPDSTTFSFPTNFFIDVPIVEASRSSGVAGILCEEGAPTKTATQKYYLVRPDAPSTSGFNLDIYAIGRWK